jgi:hypothetical protein
MTQEVVASLNNFFDSCEDHVEIDKNFQVSWSIKGIGFGSFTFFTSEDGSVSIDNECCSKEMIKRVLNNLVDKATLFDV